MDDSNQPAPAQQAAVPMNDDPYAETQKLIQARNMNNTLMKLGALLPYGKTSGNK